jgi:plastocyanin
VSILVRHFKRIGLFAALLGMMSVSLAACGGDNATPTTAPSAQATNTVPAATDVTPSATDTPVSSATDTGMEVQEVKLTIKEWQIIPKEVTVKPGKVRFIVTNEGEMAHNVTIMKDTKLLGATATFAANEGPKTIEVDMSQSGIYDMLCSLPGHAARGQKGTITVP